MIYQTHVALEDVLARRADLDKKLDSQLRFEDEIIDAVKEICHDLNTFMEHSSATNAQRVRTIDFCNQDDHISRQDLTDGEEVTSRPATSKTSKDDQKKSIPISASRLYFSKTRIHVTRRTGARISQYIITTTSPLKAIRTTLCLLLVLLNTK